MEMQIHEIADSILHPVWYWFDANEVFFGTKYYQNVGRLQAGEAHYYIPTKDEFLEALSQIDIWQDTYRKSVWDCEDYADYTKSNLLHWVKNNKYDYGSRSWWGANRQWFVASISGNLNGMNHGVNLVILRATKDSTEPVVYLVEPQLQEKLWEPYMPPYDLQRTYYNFMRAIPQYVGRILSYIGGELEVIDEETVHFRHPDLGREHITWTPEKPITEIAADPDAGPLRETWGKKYGLKIIEGRKEDRVFAGKV